MKEQDATNKLGPENKLYENQKALCIKEQSFEMDDGAFSIHTPGLCDILFLYDYEEGPLEIIIDSDCMHYYRRFYEPELSRFFKAILDRGTVNNQEEFTMTNHSIIVGFAAPDIEYEDYSFSCEIPLRPDVMTALETWLEEQRS